MRTLTQYLETWARTHPERPLFTFLNRACDPISSYTYAGFHARTNGLARVLADEIGVAAGEPILLVYPPGLEMITAFMACVKAGAIPVPVSAPAASAAAAASERLSLICASAGASRVLTDTSFLSTIAAPRQGANGSSADWLATNGLGESLDHFESRSHELLFLQYTSGSTQAPRGVMVSHANVIANCRAFLDHTPRAVSWLPHFHDMGLIGYYLFPLIRGGSAFHFSPGDFLRRPLLWLEAIGRFGATITSAPNFGFEYCLRPDKIPDEAIRGLNLATLRIMMNASEPVRPDTMERFLARFAAAGLSPDALVASYGLAENTLCASSGGRTHVRVSQRLLERNDLRIVRGRARDHNTVAFASCGTPIGGVDVRIVAAESGGREAGAGEVGEIWIAGPSRALGYWKRPELTGEVFQARLRGDRSGAEFLRTGDMGFFHDGELYVCGRLKDMITVRGVNVYPTDVEIIVERALGPPPARVAVFSVGETPERDGGLVILVERRRGGAPPDLRALYLKIRTHLHVPILTLALVARRSFATTSSGKISRHRCRDRWCRGAMRVTDRFDPPTQGEAGLDIVDYVQALVELAGGSGELTVEEIGLDSLELVTLSLALERFLAAKVGAGWLSDEMFDLRTVQYITVGTLKQVVEDIDAGRSNRQALASLYRRAAESVAERDALAMRADAVLPAGIHPTGRPAASLGQGTGAVLLTGATGFLGAYLLDALLRLTGQPIVVVARGHDVRHARRRVATALARADGAAHVDFELDPRVEVLHGDIAAPRLGLSSLAWRGLAERVGAVIHCGAEVDYVKTYGEVRGPNVSSTREVIELSCSGAPKTLHHISSTFVFGWTPAPCMSEGDFNPGMQGLDFGYTQSKWVSEQLIVQASALGLDARIYRPAFVTASRHGHYVREDILARVLSYMIRHGVSVDAGNQLSLLPVDVCAQNIVALALLDDPGARVFHLTTDGYYTMEMACRCITDRYGYEFEYVGIASMVDHMNRFCGPDDVLFPLVAFFRSNSHKIDSMRDKRYDNRNYRAARARSTRAWPEPALADTMTWLVEFLRREHLIPPVADRRVVVGRKAMPREALAAGGLA